MFVRKNNKSFKKVFLNYEGHKILRSYAVYVFSYM